jgi:hypothetical protein
MLWVNAEMVRVFGGAEAKTVVKAAVPAGDLHRAPFTAPPHQSCAHDVAARERMLAISQAPVPHPTHVYKVTLCNY